MNRVQVGLLCVAVSNIRNLTGRVKRSSMDHGEIKLLEYDWDKVMSGKNTMLLFGIEKCRYTARESAQELNYGQHRCPLSQEPA